MTVILKERNCEHCGKKACDCHTFYDDIGIEPPADIDFKAEARQERIKRCGQYRAHWRPELKKMIWYKSSCKERDCPSCQAFREGEMAIKLGGLVDAVRVVRLENEEAAREITKELDKEQYLRFPEKDGYVTLVIDTDEEIGNLLTDELAEQTAALVNTPKKTRISGSLCNKPSLPKKESDIPHDEIKVKEFHIDFTDSELGYKDIQEYVLRETSHLDPRTKEELQDDIYTLEDFTLLAVNNLLGDSERIHFLSKKIVRVNMEQIDWQKLSKSDRTTPF